MRSMHACGQSVGNRCGKTPTDVRGRAPIRADSCCRAVFATARPARVGTVTSGARCVSVCRSLRHLQCVDRRPGRPLVPSPLEDLVRRQNGPIPAGSGDGDRLWYIGANRWRERFTDALGAVFEAYVGDQLRLMKNVQVLGQVHYTSKGSGARSCDWIVVTDEVVVLVEVKCARPTLDYRTGGAEGLADVATKLGEAVGQIERTATQIADRRPAFSHIPDDRPARGLIVTLEPYYLRQTMRDHLVESDILPIGVVWAHSSSRA